MKKIIATSFTLLALTMSGQALADAAAGQAKAARCAGCHGDKGITTNTTYPNLAGQNAGYLGKAIRDYKDGKRDHAMMKTFVSTLSDDDINDLAAYYSSLK